jgi:hypothetical protein
MFEGDRLANIEKINYKIDQLVKKRNHAAELDNAWLAISYQQDIDRLIASLKDYESGNV